MADGTWGLAEAKAKLSEVIDKAVSQGPQHITRNGRDAVVVVSAEEWAERTREPKTLLEFFEQSPLRGADIQIERDPDVGRDFKFE